MKREIAAAIVTALLWFGPAASAEVVLDEGFSDLSRVDRARTTARVDPANRRVVLPWQPLSGSVDMLENTPGYVIASKEGIRLYELNDATGRADLNPVYSCPWAVEATGVSVRQDNLSIWAVTPGGISCYRFNGSGVSDDPALKVAGLTGVISVAAFKGRDSALLLHTEGNLAKITRYDAAGFLTPSLEFNTGITGPVSISVIGDSPDFVLFTENAAYYFLFDEKGGTYVEDPARRITGIAGVVSGSSDGIGNSVLTSGDLGYYINLDAGRTARAEVLSPGPVAGPVAVSLRPGSFDQVYMDEKGNVRWWTWDDSAGRMVRETSMEVAGLNLNRGYAHPGSYFSGAFKTAAACDAVRLTVADDLPAGTTLQYFVSSDGGLTFNGVIPGRWAAVPRGDSFVVRAVLDTIDPLKTPEILHLVLEADQDLALEGRVWPYPAERGKNVTITARVVSLTAGGPVDLDSLALRYPLEARADGSPALPEGSLPIDVPMAFNPAAGDWEYTFTVPGKTAAGRWPDDGVYLVEITAVRGALRKRITLNLEIQGHLLGRLIIRTLDW